MRHMSKLRRLFLLFCLVAPLSASAQLMVPNNDEIFARTMDPDSPFNFASLMMRYNAGDTTLTLEDYHYLYYGFAFTDMYRPLASIPAEDKILMVLEESEVPGYDGMLEIIRQGREVMKADPFSPKNLNFLVFAYGAIGDTVNERINHDRMTKVLAVIGASGTGETERSPMHILRFSHAADFLGSRGLVMANRRVVSRTTEYISLARRDGRIRGYFFDFSRIFWNDPGEAPVRERRWKINDWPPGQI